MPILLMFSLFCNINKFYSILQSLASPGTPHLAAYSAQIVFTALSLSKDEKWFFFGHMMNAILLFLSTLNIKKVHSFFFNLSTSADLALAAVLTQGVLAFMGICVNFLKKRPLINARKTAEKGKLKRLQIVQLSGVLTSCLQVILLVCKLCKAEIYSN